MTDDDSIIGKPPEQLTDTELTVALGELSKRTANITALLTVLRDQLSKRGLDPDAAPDRIVNPDALIAEPATTWSDLDVMAGCRTIPQLLDGLHTLALRYAEERDKRRGEHQSQYAVLGDAGAGAAGQELATQWELPEREDDRT
jgi:hypothetical protein